MHTTQTGHRPWHVMRRGHLRRAARYHGEFEVIARARGREAGSELQRVLSWCVQPLSGSFAQLALGWWFTRSYADMVAQGRCGWFRNSSDLINPLLSAVFVGFSASDLIMPSIALLTSISATAPRDEVPSYVEWQHYIWFAPLCQT